MRWLARQNWHFRHVMTDVPTYLIESATDAAAVLTNARVARGWTAEELDDHAGLSDRYTAKLENPRSTWGKMGLHISPMWELWADALGFVLVLMPRERALAIGAEPSPVRRGFTNRNWR